MKFNAFEQFSDSISDMKGLLFPIQATLWFKLGLVSLLAGKGASFQSQGSNMNSSGDTFSGGLDGLRESLGALYYWLLPGILVLFLIGLLFAFISSVFSFIFIDAIEKKQVAIKRDWRANKPSGVSYFLFRIVIGLISLGVLVLAALPFAIPILSNGWSSYAAAFEASMLLWIIPLILVVLLVFFVLGLFNALVWNFSLVHMYYTRNPVWVSIKETFAKMRKAKLSVLVYLLSKLVINFCVAIITLIALIPVVILVGIPAVLLGILFYSLVSAYGWSVLLIVSVVILGLVFMLGFAYLFSVVLLPVTTFIRYFSIRNYRELMK